MNSLIRNSFFLGLLDTGAIKDRLFVIRDGVLNLFVIEGSGGLICVDAGWCSRRVAHEFKILGLSLKDVAAVFLTHLHWDHAMCAGLYADARIFVGEHEVPSYFMKRKLSACPLVKVCHDQEISIAGLNVRVVDTPGHTPGSVSYLVEKHILFTGDTLRIRRGTILPFPAIFNKNDSAVSRSIRKLSDIRGVRYLLTSHYGMTRDIEGAFMMWRGNKDNRSLRDRGER